MEGTFRLIHVRGKLIWLLAFLGNRKVFQGGKGHNVCLRVRWGEFVISETALTYVNWPIIDLLIPEGNGFKGAFLWWGRKMGEFRLSSTLEIDKITKCFHTDSTDLSE